MPVQWQAGVNYPPDTEVVWQGYLYRALAGGQWRRLNQVQEIMPQYTAWLPGVHYERGQLLTYRNGVYRRERSATSSEGYPPDCGDASYYTYVGPYEALPEFFGPAVPWTLGQTYVRDAIVVYQGSLYRTVRPVFAERGYEPTSWCGPDYFTFLRHTAPQFNPEDEVMPRNSGESQSASTYEFSPQIGHTIHQESGETYYFYRNPSSGWVWFRKGRDGTWNRVEPLNQANPNGNCSCTDCTRRYTRVSTTRGIDNRLLAPLPPECSVCDEAYADCECVVCPACQEKTSQTCDTCDNCVDDCCRCFTCRSCDDRYIYTEQCSNCQRCHECCECLSCNACGLRTNDLCNDYHCDGCCDCDRERIPLVEGTGAFHEDKRSGPKRYVAAEIEIAAFDEDSISEVIEKWGAAIVEDGSLPSGGREINTAPAKGGAWRTEIDEICDALKDSGARVNQQCGLHVHVDARDYNYYDIRRLILVYARIEPALFALVSPSRRNNTYCHPCGPKYLQALQKGNVKHAIAKENVFRAIYKRNPDRYDINKRQLKRNKYHESRYNALNLHSWVYRGTVECRLHQGTANKEKIRLWGELWARIIDYAARESDATVNALPNPEDATSSYALLREVICKGMTELQTYLDERAKEFGVIKIQTKESEKETV